MEDKSNQNPASRREGFDKTISDENSGSPLDSRMTNRKTESEEQREKNSEVRKAVREYALECKRNQQVGYISWAMRLNSEMGGTLSENDLAAVLNQAKRF